MFLRDLLKKINNFIKKSSKLFTKDNLKHLLINNFREIVIIIICFGILVIIFTMFIAFSNKNNNELNIENQVFEEKKSKDQAKGVIDELLLTPDDFIISDSKSFDITNDYQEFMPMKKYELPDKNIVSKEYENILENEIQESLKFNFEKRKSRNKK